MPNTRKLLDHRLHVMKGLLDWEGEIRNARIRQIFDVQPVQASRLLAELRDNLGMALIEERRTQAFKLVNPEHPCSDMGMEEYFRLVAASDDSVPRLVDARTNLTEIQPYIFAAIRKALLAQTGVVIEYASINNPVLAKRTLFPHTIIHIGRRCHIRAWCATRNDFRDFTLGRIRSATGYDAPAPHPIAEDVLWHTMVDIHLSAHRALSPAQQQVVRNEYFQGENSRVLSTRACLTSYTIQDLRAAMYVEREYPPEYQLEVSNAGNLVQYLF